MESKHKHRVTKLSNLTMSHALINLSVLTCDVKAALYFDEGNILAGKVTTSQVLIYKIWKRKILQQFYGPWGRF
jgi:hypothetical protein